MTRKKAFERWETKIANTKVAPRAVWPVAKSLMKRDRPKAPTAIHGPFYPTFHLLEKANAIADCLENQFTCVTKTISDGWRLEFKLYSKL
jgi:hypothetical protein